MMLSNPSDDADDRTDAHRERLCSGIMRVSRRLLSFFCFRVSDRCRVQHGAGTIVMAQKMPCCIETLAHDHEGEKIIFIRIH